MDIVQEIEGDVVIQKVNLKRATYNQAENLKTNLEKDFNDGMKKIVVDLSLCKYMDSTFLGALVQELKNFSSKGGKLRLAGVHSEVEVLLNMTGMHRVFSIFKTREEAVASFKQ
jgi:anti-sigma B factor antagonist